MSRAEAATKAGPKTVCDIQTGAATIREIASVATDIFYQRSRSFLNGLSGPTQGWDAYICAKNQLSVYSAVGRRTNITRLSSSSHGGRHANRAVDVRFVPRNCSGALSSFSANSATEQPFGNQEADRCSEDRTHLDHNRQTLEVLQLLPTPTPNRN